MQSSTVTVAVIDPATPSGADGHDRRAPGDFRIEWYSGSGAGGQHRNKHQNSARVIHLPTGIVRTAQTRSRESSLAAAMAAIHRALDDQAAGQAQTAVNGVRRDQLGSGAKADKRRTYRFQDDAVIDHETGRKHRARTVMAGGIDMLWPS